MFQRASKKLGLDQAIFLGGTFATTKFAPKRGDSKVVKLGGYIIGKKEIDILLKKGIIGLLDKSEAKSQAFIEENIE